MRYKKSDGSVMECLQRIRWKNEKPSDNRAYEPTEVEHIANIFTHGLFILPVAWFSFGLIKASTSTTQYWASVVYGIALVGLFSVSTIFHLVSFAFQSGRLRDILHRGDRAMIYIFIAGSYTPWLTLRYFPDGSWSEELRWVIWVLASLGILYQQLFHEKYKLFETIVYVVIALTPSLSVLEMAEVSGIRELQISGFFYILGIVFFKSDGRIPLAHAIWHLHVVLGTSIHYYAVSKYLIGPENQI